jgi:hypothetical protein
LCASGYDVTISVHDEPVRGAIGDLRAFQRPGLETMRRRMAIRTTQLMYVVTQPEGGNER